MISILVGVATVYAGQFVGQPLYCDCDQTLYYDHDNPPWVAIDVNLYREWADCGDVLLLSGDGWVLRAKALDAGPLMRYYVADYGADLRIVADVPAHLAPFEGLSSPVRMVNLTRLYRSAEVRLVE